MPTIVWNEMRVMLTGGRWADATASRPSTRAFGLLKASTQSHPGVAMPELTSPARDQPQMADGAVHGMNVARLAGEGGKAGGVVNPRVDGDDRPRAAEASEDDRQGAEHVRPRRQAVPAVDVDPDEDRLEEEGEALDGEAEAE